MFCNGLLGSGYATGGMFLMMGFGFLIFLALIFLAFKLIKFNSPSPYSLSNNSALIILNERYAKGEINEEEYTKKKIILSKKH
ncbi:SHOCT domain-containing protein [Clostridium sp.]|uniref:SHOCT domain-containing protein n=1 Tax=Clostridium sp. TaxID=1506 RepID=UPI00261A2699|nr:SHOCT domain-containing protein [uncultured Clostridium sp.]